MKLVVQTYHVKVDMRNVSDYFHLSPAVTGLSDVSMFRVALKDVTNARGLFDICLFCFFFLTFNNQTHLLLLFLPAGGGDLLCCWSCVHQAGGADHAAAPGVRLQPGRVRHIHAHAVKDQCLFLQLKSCKGTGCLRVKDV